MTIPKPPRSYQHFVARFPALGEAWEAIRRAEADGPLTHRERRLIKLGIALGAGSSGGAGSGVRKALAAGATPEEIEHVVALAASTIGMPKAVASLDWIRHALDKGD